MPRSNNSFVGKWRIVEMEVWDRDYIDLVVPGHITFDRDLDGSFQFGTVRGWLDCRIEQIGKNERIEFSWEGFSDADQGCGRGWALIRGDELHGRLYIHAGDDSSFRAQRAPIGSRKRAA
jgi:hypothetical protein